MEARFEGRADEEAGPGAWGAGLEGLLRFTAGPAYAGLTDDWVTRQANLPVSRARVRGARRAAEADRLPERAVADALAVLASDIALERKVLRCWQAGDGLLSSVPSDVPQARRKFEEGLVFARSQSALHREATVPRSLYKLAEALTRLAEAQPIASAARQALLDKAAECYAEIVAQYPKSRDAPHVYIPWGWLFIKGVDPRDAASWNVARQRAYGKFEELRHGYPRYHLWGEDAVTTPLEPAAQPPTPGPDEEIIHFERELIQPKIASWRYANGYWSVWLSNADGTQAKRLTGELVPTNWCGWGGIPLVWSSTGDNLLATARWRQDSTYKVAVHLVDARTGQVRLVGNVRSFSYGAKCEIWPSFSSDGSRVLFNLPPDGIYSQPVAGGEIVREFAAVDPVESRWTPDGTAILYTCSSPASPSNQHGSGIQIRLRRLTDAIDVQVASQGYLPHPSPDGKSVAYVDDPDAGGVGLFLTTPRSSGEGAVDCTQWSPPVRVATIANDGWGLYHMQWSRDGKCLLVTQNSKQPPIHISRPDDEGGNLSDSYASRLIEIDVATGKLTPLSEWTRWSQGGPQASAMSPIPAGP